MSSAIGLAAAAESGAETLTEAILAYVERNPTASLGDVAGYAETRRQELGITYDFVLRGGAPEAVLKADDSTLRIPVWPEEGPCGERWVGIHALRVQRDSIELVEDGRVITVRRPVGLDLDVHTILAPDGKTLIAEVEVPWQTMPWSVAGDGQAVHVDFPLFEEAYEWWATVRAQHPHIASEYPYLLLSVSSDGRTSFVTDPASYGDEPVEILEGPGGKGAYHHRWRFRNSGFVIDFQAPCT